MNAPLPLSSDYTISPTNAAYTVTIGAAGSEGGTLTPNGVITQYSTPPRSRMCLLPGYITCDSFGNKIPATNLLAYVRANPTTVLALPSATCAATDADVFTYSLSLSTQATAPSIYIQTKATQSFGNNAFTAGNIYAALASTAAGAPITCSGCHAGGNEPASWTTRSHRRLIPMRASPRARMTGLIQTHQQRRASFL